MVVRVGAKWRARVGATIKGDACRVPLDRKDRLFCGSDNGGNTATVLFNMIATCQLKARDGETS